jgi:hypothetical protein
MCFQGAAQFILPDGSLEFGAVGKSNDRNPDIVRAEKTGVRTDVHLVYYQRIFLPKSLQKDKGVFTQMAARFRVQRNSR